MQLIRRTGKVDYFVGKTRETILLDTNNGKEFGGVRYRHSCIVQRAVVEKLGFQFFHEGVTSVEESGDGCFLLGSA